MTIYHVLWTPLIILGGVLLVLLLTGIGLVLAVSHQWQRLRGYGASRSFAKARSPDAEAVPGGRKA